jgi:hypothetical protein
MRSAQCLPLRLGSPGEDGSHGADAIAGSRSAVLSLSSHSQFRREVSEHSRSHAALQRGMMRFENNFSASGYPESRAES